VDAPRVEAQRYSVYWLYWYKSTDTDAEQHAWMLLEWKLKGTQFAGSSERERNADAGQEACYGPRDLL
jgi:hypothetical protein